MVGEGCYTASVPLRLLEGMSQLYLTRKEKGTRLPVADDDRSLQAIDYPCGKREPSLAPTNGLEPTLRMAC